MIDASVFREYDIRGLVGDQLDHAVVRRLGQAFGTYIQERGPEYPQVVLGRDNRRSGLEFRNALADGLMATGCRVVDIGEVITPILYYSRVLYGIDAAVMITASHNPPQFNGFKIALGAGTLYGEAIQDVRRVMDAGHFRAGSGTFEQRDAVPAYLRMLQEKVQLARPLRVAVDCGNGTAGPFALAALTGWGCAVTALYCDSDPGFPHHHPDPVKATNLRDLVAAVRSGDADLGVAFDGDGDRIGVVDDQGQIIWGDVYMSLMWREVLARHPGAPAIVEVKCSQALWDEVERLGGKPLFHRTGHSLIKAKMRELGAVFTGEMSGHMFFADEYFGFDDALYAAGRLLRLVAGQERPLSELVADVPAYHATPEVRVDCPDDRKFAVVADLLAYFRNHRPVVDVDGARVLFPAGWGLVRASNTQPALVLRCEGRTAGDLEQICGEMETALHKVAGIAAVNWA